MKVKFLPQDIEFEIQPGQSIMGLAHEKGIAIRSACNGMPSCAECRVRIVDGDWNLNPPARKELSLIGTGYYIDQRRLSCQALCFGDVTVDTTEQIDKASEGPVTKKFLTKIHKTSANETHSLGGVLIEQDDALLQELKKDVPDSPDNRPINRPIDGGNRDGGRSRDSRGGNRHQQNSRGGGGGGNSGQGNQQARGDRNRNNGGPQGGQGGIQGSQGNQGGGGQGGSGGGGGNQGGPGGGGGQGRRRRRGGRNRNRGPQG